MQRADAVFHRVPLFLGGVNKWLFDREKIEHEMAEWLMGQADYGDVVVELDRARKVATAYVCGFGDEPFDAAKRALGKCRATDRRGKYMFCDVKPHDDYGWAVARRADEAADRLALEALAREAADRENAAPANAADRAPPAKRGRSPEPPASAARPRVDAPRPLVAPAAAAARPPAPPAAAAARPPVAPAAAARPPAPPAAAAAARPALPPAAAAPAPAPAPPAAPAPAPRPPATAPAARAPAAPAPAPAPAPRRRGFVDYDAIWSRALASPGDKAGCAYGRPLVHRCKDACELQCDKERDRRVWAYDLPAPAGQSGAPKRYVAATVDELERALRRVAPGDRHCYEVIDARRPCWPYFDLEFYRGGALNAGVDGDALAARVVDAAVAELEAAAAREDPPAALRVEAVVLASERPAKFSRHVVLRVFRGDGGPAPLAGSRAAGVLAARVSAALGPAGVVEAEGRKPTAFVDAGVYTRARCFRLEGCSKLGAAAGSALAVSGRAARGAPGPIPAAPGLRGTLVAPLLLAAPRCLGLDAPTATALPPPATATARAPPAPPAPRAPAGRVDAAAWERAWRGATATPLLDVVSLDHPYITVSTRGAGRPPPPLDAVFDAALASLRSAAGGEPRASRWAYKAAAHPSERLLHVTLAGAVVCASKGRPHKSQKAIVTADPVSGACWQRCWDAADCSTVAANAAGGAVALANKRRLPDVPRADFKALLDYERDFHAGVVARRDAPAPPAPTCGHGNGPDCAACAAIQARGAGT